MLLINIVCLFVCIVGKSGFSHSGGTWAEDFREYVVEKDTCAQGGQGNRRVENTVYSEFHYLYPSPDVIWLIKSKIMRWVGYVEIVGNRGGLYGVLVGRPQ